MLVSVLAEFVSKAPRSIAIGVLVAKQRSTVLVSKAVLAEFVSEAQRSVL